MNLYEKIEGILSKAGFTGFYSFFLRPDRPSEPPIPAQAALPSGIVSGLSQVGEVRQTRD